MSRVYTRFWGAHLQRLTVGFVRPRLDGAYQLLREELIAARIRASLTQKDVAARLGGGQQLWSKVESGERRLDLVELVAVAQLLHLDLAALIARLRKELSL